MDARSWARLVSLVAPGMAPLPPRHHAREGTLPGGMLLVAHDGTSVLRALHTLRGVVATEGPWAGAETLKALAARCDTHFAVALRRDAAERFMERVGGRCTTADDAVDTTLLALGVLRELIDDGALDLLPTPLRSVPLPPVEVVRATWDRVLPDGHSAVIALFEGPALVTGLALRRRGGVIDQVHGVESIRAWSGPLGGDFRRDHRVIRAAVERALGPVAVGLFAPEATVLDLLRAEAPGGWAKAVAVRDVMVEPMPPWAAMATGVSALRAAADESRRWAFSADGWLAKTTRRVIEAAGTVDLQSVLGFDPLAVLGVVLRESRTRPAQPDDPA
jgi:hypothetical protein